MKVLLSIKPEFAEKIFNGTKYTNLGKVFSKIKMLIKLLFMPLHLCNM